MTCSESQDLLGLYREGELRAEQLDELRRHLATCASCMAVAEEYQRAELYVRKLRTIPPGIPDAAEFAQSVVAQIRHGAAGRQATSYRGFGERLLDVFEIPSVRLASAGITAALVLVFFFQSLQLTSGIAGLEARYDRPGRPVLVPETGYVIDLAGSPAPHMGSLLSFLGLTRQELRSREMIVNRTTVRSLEEQLSVGPVSTLNVRPADLTPEQLDELRLWISNHVTQKRILSLKGE